MMELYTMLFITKGNISLRVLFKEAKVNVAPVRGEHDNAYLLATLARNEELLAQVHLNIAPQNNPKDQLALYYTRRGWEVKEMPLPR